MDEEKKKKKESWRSNRSNKNAKKLYNSLKKRSRKKCLTK